VIRLISIGSIIATLFVIFLFVGTLPVASGFSTTARVAGKVLLVSDSSCPTDIYAATALTHLHISYKQISETQLSSANLSKYTVIYVSTLNLDYQACANVVTALKKDKSAITAWLQAGVRGIVAEDEIDLTGSPLAVAFSWLPSPIKVSSQYQGAYGNTVTIVRKTNATKGLTSTDLSNWNYSFHCQATSGKFTTLAKGNSGTNNLPITVAQQSGSHGTVLTTCQDPAVAYVGQGISYGGTLLLDMLSSASQDSV
jgi:hypothetical protein